MHTKGSLLVVLSFASFMWRSAVASNGHVAYTLTKDFVESFQDLFQRVLIKEVGELELRDVRVQQKTEQGRLNSLMSLVRLQEVDLKGSNFTVDFVENGDLDSDSKCQTDFDIYFKLTGLSMVFEFDQFFETESQRVVEEQAIGSFHLPNMTFSLRAVPYIHQEKFRIRLIEHALQIGDYQFKLFTKEKSQFQDILQQYSTVFAEHMRKQVNLDLSERLALAVQKGSHALFRRVQQNVKVKAREILMNKHLINMCHISGAALEHDSIGKVTKRAPGGISFEIDGTFHRSQDLLTNTTATESLSGSQQVPPGTQQIVISKLAFDSLLEATFKETGHVKITQEPIVMTIEDLEEMAEGFANVFDEDGELKVQASLDQIFSTQFDADFGNIPFKALLTVDFINPIEESFLAAQAKVFVKGTAEVTIIDGFSFAFSMSQEKAKVQQFSPYFHSDFDLADFENEYLEKLHDQIFDALNAKFKAGIELPLGTDLNIGSTEHMKVSVQKDYLLVQSKPTSAAAAAKSDERHQRFSYFSTYDPEKQTLQRRKYPVTWVVDQNHEVAKLGANEETTAFNETTTCKGKACRDTLAGEKNIGSHRVDEL